MTIVVAPSLRLGCALSPCRYLRCAVALLARVDARACAQWLFSSADFSLRGLACNGATDVTTRT